MDEQIHLKHALAPIAELLHCLSIAAALVELAALLVLKRVQQGLRDEGHIQHKLTHLVDNYIALISHPFYEGFSTQIT
jgi:hypothetical protein